MSQAQIDAIDALTAQVNKVKAEVIAKIAELEAAIGSNDDAAVDAAIEGLKVAVQGADDVIADAPPAEPPVVV